MLIIVIEFGKRLATDSTDKSPSVIAGVQVGVGGEFSLKDTEIP